MPFSKILDKHYKVVLLLPLNLAMDSHHPSLISFQLKISVAVRHVVICLMCITMMSTETMSKIKKENTE